MDEQQQQFIAGMIRAQRRRSSAAASASANAAAAATSTATGLPFDLSSPAAQAFFAATHHKKPNRRGSNLTQPTLATRGSGSQHHDHHPDLHDSDDSNDESNDDSNSHEEDSGSSLDSYESSYSETQQQQQQEVQRSASVATPFKQQEGEDQAAALQMAAFASMMRARGGPTITKEQAPPVLVAPAVSTKAANVVVSDEEDDSQDEDDDDDLEGSSEEEEDASMSQEEDEAVNMAALANIFSQRRGGAAAKGAAAAAPPIVKATPVVSHNNNNNTDNDNQAACMAAMMMAQRQSRGSASAVAAAPKPVAAPVAQATAPAATLSSSSDDETRATHMAAMMFSQRQRRGGGAGIRAPAPAPKNVANTTLPPPPPTTTTTSSSMDVDEEMAALDALAASMNQKFSTTKPTATTTVATTTAQNPTPNKTAAVTSSNVVKKVNDDDDDDDAAAAASMMMASRKFSQRNIKPTVQTPPPRATAQVVAAATAAVAPPANNHEAASMASLASMFLQRKQQPGMAQSAISMAQDEECNSEESSSFESDSEEEDGSEEEENSENMEEGEEEIVFQSYNQKEAVASQQHHESSSSGIPKVMAGTMTSNEMASMDALADFFSKQNKKATTTSCTVSPQVPPQFGSPMMIEEDESSCSDNSAESEKDGDDSSSYEDEDDDESERMLGAQLRAHLASTAPQTAQQQEVTAMDVEMEGTDQEEDESEGGFSVIEDNEDDCESDSDEGTSEFSSGEAGSEFDSSEDWSGSSDESSSDGSDYSDLLNEMTTGRRLPVAREGEPVAKGLPVSQAPAPQPMMQDESQPLEGLAMLKNIRSELEKVGQLIVKNKQGEKFLERAQILASINYLASNVPRAVLQDLGQEIRDSIKREQDRKNRKRNTRNVLERMVQVCQDDDSSASELSEVGMIEDYSEEEDDFFPEAKFNTDVLPKNNVGERASHTRRLVDIKENRLSLDSRSGHKRTSFNSNHSGQRLMPLMRDEAPERRYTRTYSFGSASSSEQSDWDEPTIPIVTYFECALLFIDVSGFTKLSTLLDPENLSKVMNSYFEVLLDHVHDFNGDIQKFAGDALFAEFRATPTLPLSKCVELAAACAAALVRDCADFPVATVCSLVDASADGIPTALNVHCGLGVGEMAGVHVGDNENRREYLYLGNPIRQTAYACDHAKLGEAAASKEFCAILKGSNIFDVDLSSGHEAYVIAEGAKSKLACNETELLLSQRRNAMSRGITEHVEGLQPESLKEYRRLMSLYVHPVAVSNDTAAENDFQQSNRNTSDMNNRDRQLQEAELRSCYVMFINPIISVEMTGDAKKDSASVDYVQTIMKITNRELRRYNGHLRQFIKDDKGLVLIATFGLRGSTFPNMVGERALPCTIALHNAFQFEMGIESRIGATFGDVYCGAVGGEKRHEYAVMGPSVNLAARLMSSKTNPGVLVDNAVRRMASQSFAFNALEPVKAKGYKDLVQIFEPLSSVERGWGRIVPNFVGRVDEITKITKIATTLSRRECIDPQLIFIKSSTGMGKSTLLAHAIDRIKKQFITTKRQGLGIAKHIGRESDSLRPFAAAAHLLRKMIPNYRGSFDDCKSIASGKDSCYSSKVGSSFGDDSTHGGRSTVLSKGQFEDRLDALFVDVNAPGECVEYTRALLLEDETKQNQLFPELDDSMITKLAAAFHRCIQNLKLCILAIDDAHQCDEASWLVFEELFQSSDNLLMIGTTSSTTIADMKINKQFMSQLEDVYAKVGRYHVMTLNNLSKDEVTHMIMKSMALQKQQVTESILDSVYNQSLGMPLVANELITELKERKHDGDQLGISGNTESIMDIFLNKIDGFDLTSRDVLNVGAMLGQTFHYGDVVVILSALSEAKKEDVEKDCDKSVAFLLKEGILVKVECPNSNGVYAFNHELWRAIPLRLMLDSRKRDIHRKIALLLEEKVALLTNEEASVEVKEKIFEHWKATGDTTKSVTAALALNDMYERSGNVQQCVRVIQESLVLWGWESDTTETRLGGLSKNFLNHVGPEDLCNIITMLVSLGKAYTNAGRPNDGVIWWENALRVMSSTKSASKISDRSILFPAFNGLSEAIQEGHLVQDVYCRYEQAMIRKYIQETRAHGRLIHHIHALFLQMKLYGRQGDLDKAIAVHSIIKSIYKPDRHSDKLRNVYGQDSGALSYALCAFWETLEGDKKTGLKMCRSALKDMLPRLGRDFNSMFNLVFPLTMAFKEAGYPNEARAFFEKLIAMPYDDCPEDHPLHYLVDVFPAISILYKASNARKVSKSDLVEWSNWVLKQPAYGQKLQQGLGRFGRCANSLQAEICLLIVQQLPKNDILRQRVLKKGNDLITNAIISHRRFGLKCAVKPAKSIQAKLRSAGKK